MKKDEEVKQLTKCCNATVSTKLTCPSAVFSHNCSECGKEVVFDDVYNANDATQDRIEKVPNKISRCCRKVVKFEINGWTSGVGSKTYFYRCTNCKNGCDIDLSSHVQADYERAYKKALVDLKEWSDKQEGDIHRFDIDHYIDDAIENYEFEPCGKEYNKYVSLNQPIKEHK